MNLSFFFSFVLYAHCSLLFSWHYLYISTSPSCLVALFRCIFCFLEFSNNLKRSVSEHKLYIKTKLTCKSSAPNSNLYQQPSYLSESMTLYFTEEFFQKKNRKPYNFLFLTFLINFNHSIKSSTFVASTISKGIITCRVSCFLFTQASYATAAAHFACPRAS